MVEKYEVIIRDKVTGNRWSLLFRAEDFAHAEKQAQPFFDERDEIITISKDYVERR